MWRQVLENGRSAFNEHWPYSALVPVGVGGAALCWVLCGGKRKTIEMGDGWWGPGTKPDEKEDTRISPFRVEVSEDVIKDLYDRLDRTRYISSLEDSEFHYGVNTVTLKKVISYWRNTFDWSKQVEIINRYPHYTTNISFSFSFRSVKGLHLNVVFLGKGGFKVLISLILGRYLPWLVGLTRQDVKLIYPYFEKNVYAVLRESGYLHIQATKPDTVGSALNDSPAGLAAYILEKFSTWTNPDYRALEDGGLDRKYSLDDLLTNVMIYWVSGSITSSMRFYKENFTREFQFGPFARTPVYVPTGIAAFPHELMHNPKIWVKERHKNIVNYNYMPRGGHFAAFEEPELLARDIQNLNCQAQSKDHITVANASVNLFILLNHHPWTWTPVYVPTGIAAFPHELMHNPKIWVKERHKNIVNYNYMPRGGHFAAFEEPELLARDIQNFVSKVEKNAK
ncbi:PREDICTED: epoxide hydrolase 1-like [Nanorana parkeri]|uniref:epoxide hydrolase 1-like n=1 Tax=Nanorana parkeri TaxID=125878 RepID=UPI0008543EAF|nr:PREDICTED: epoxide hydrolase 1-like [Nanorana parkeri]